MFSNNMKSLLLLAVCCCIFCDALEVYSKSGGGPTDSDKDTLKMGVVSGDHDTTANLAVDTGACASRPCQNNAVCFYYGSFHYVCACKTGYTGRNCQYKACKRIFFFLQPYDKDCTSLADVCILEDHKPKCRCFDPHVCP